MKPVFSFILSLFALIPPLQTAAAADFSTPKAYPADGANYGHFSMAKPPLLPLPQRVEWEDKKLNIKEINHSIDASPLPAAERNDGRFRLLADQMEDFFKAHGLANDKAGYSIRVKKGLPKGMPQDAPEWQKDEAYGIEAGAEGVTITTRSMKGLLNASQTLKQLIVRRKGKTTIALCRIADWPDLQIRALMNDVGRNFLPLELIKQEIDSIALLKFNTYHFHMTDNPGWRLESKIYPQLNRANTMSRHPGKYFSQDEFKELVEYCRLRGIMLIPEMDMPGHCEAFRKALGIQNMRDPKATEALEKLIAELASLVPAEHMPYIHIGTDEAREAHEKVGEEELKRYFAAVEKAGRTPIRWQPGLSPKGYKGAVEHLWMGRGARHSWPSAGARYVDSHDTYVNHLDPFETGSIFYFRRPCPFKYAEGLGFILCAWPDLPVANPQNQLLQTPIYPAVAFCSQSMWNGPHPELADPAKDELMIYFSNLPKQGSELLEGFAECENRVLAIRDRFFVDKEFNYVRQAHVPWKLIGPFPHGGNVDKEFAVEKDILDGKAPAASYSEGGKEYSWHEGEYTGHTLLFKHYCDYPTMFNGGGYGYPHKNHTYYALQYIWSPRAQTVPFWVSGHTWPTSDWRTGPVTVPGKWFHANPKFWVNGREIEPPKWQQSGHNPNTTGMVDENYHCRKPTMIPLKKGWNQVFIKSPNNNNTRRWMFTFAPVKTDSKNFGCNVKEFPGLKFATKPQERDENDKPRKRRKRH